MAKRGKRSSALAKSATPGERDTYWLEHFRAIEAEGIQVKVYAAREGLAVQSLYQAKRRLVKRGAWPRTRGVSKFTRVHVVEAAQRARGCRLRIGTHAVLEWDELPSVEVLSALLERVVALR
jgi:hypothetical protein